MTLWVLFGLFALLVVLEVPVAFALALSSIATIAFVQPIPISIVVQRMGTGLDSFVLIAIPLFVLAGHLLNRAGIAARIFEFAAALVGHIKGGLAHVNVVASMIFAGMSGVAQADAAGLGVVEVNAMRKEGFDPAFAAAVSAASSIIGPIIPPSVIMVVYAVMVQVSVADMFLAGFLPGILMGLTLMAMIYWMVSTGRVVAPPTQPMSYPRLGRSFVRALPALAAPILLTAGLLSGVATPTELGALTVVYAAALGFAQRELTLADLLGSARETLSTCGVLVFIIACAVPFGWIVATSQAPMKLAALMMSISDNKFVILLIINIALLVIGCFMETTAILLIATPTLYPTIVALGIDPVHFGIILVVNLLIGTLTPPFGVILFIMMDIAKVSLAQMARAVLPFYVPLFLTLLVVTYWADFVLAVPRFFGRP
ncbi:MAG TPA: TRAP transporter large permease [Caldimonas sp.]|jgi:tripartite ATP-independent transporter DctM subunit|nr:TRAP transporter large permease [Caldimonas sp.]HEX2542332.1 TRAP transporter large permease [Caldimonas sp.]